MSQNLKDGLPDFSRLKAQTSRKHSKSKVPASSVESLSHFIKKKPTQTEINQKVHGSSTSMIEESYKDTNHKLISESPYKNLIKIDTKIILDDSAGDAADFKSPVISRKPKNVQNFKSKGKTPVKKGQSKRGRPKGKTKNSTAKVITDNFQYFGENPEHMAMAMALSKSSYEAECGSSCQSPSKEELSDVSEIMRNAKPTFLERFGFTSCKKVLSVENRRQTAVSETTKKNKNRFKYITPILNIRTSEERNSLIDSKISLTLHQQIAPPQTRCKYVINSNKLINYFSKERSIFNLDEIYEKNYFNVKCLELPENIYRCGCLLKDWNLIPGRDKSPCKILKDESVEKELASHKGQSSSKIDDIKENTFSKITFPTKFINKEISPNEEKLSVEHLSKTLSLGVSCSLSLSTEIQKTALGSFSSESKDSGCTDLAKSTVNFFGSSCRSISPDLFNSDDEVDQQYLNKTKSDVTESSISPKTDVEITEDKSKSIKSQVMSNEIIDLTDDDNCENNNSQNTNLSQDIKIIMEDSNDDECDNNSQNTNLSQDIKIIVEDSNDNECGRNSQNTNLSSDIKIIAEDRNNFLSRQLKSQSNKNTITSQENIYNLDEFENNDYEKMALSPENEKYNNILKKYDKYIDHIHVETNNDFISNREAVVATMVKIQVSTDTDKIGFAKDNTTSNIDSSFHETEIVIDNDFTFKTPSKEKCFKTSSDEDIIRDSFCLHSISENCVNVYNTDDSLSDSDKEEIGVKHDTTPKYTSKGNQACKRSFLFCNEVSLDEDYCNSDANIENNESNVTNNKSLSLKRTPKKSIGNKGVKSPCFDEPVFFDSTDLNVTDYVNNMLNEENLSYKIQHINDLQLNNEGQCAVNNEEELSLSQGSQSSVILDEELNYSSHFATPAKDNNEARNRTKINYNNEIEELENVIILSPESQEHGCLEISPRKNLPLVDPKSKPKATITKDISTPNNVIIKTDNVTPMPEYEKMTTPLINKELQKVGVKPLKRTRGAKLLKYIYESTHPVVGPKENGMPDNSESDEDKDIIKRRKKSKEGLNNLEYNISSDSNSLISSIEIIGDRIVENEKLEDLIFERKQLARIASCKVPLQIVWHNLVSSDHAIKENILLYEPLQLESLHMMLKKQGFKFHIQDLLTFLDKKCVTIRTTQKQGKNHR